MAENAVKRRRNGMLAVCKDYVATELKFLGWHFAKTAAARQPQSKY
jgi:hypothetical protein